jgi:hypothetical protein
MASNGVVYASCLVTWNDVVLSQEASVTVRTTTGSQAVGTVPLGYAGESPGMQMTEIDVESRVPITPGIELDPSNPPGQPSNPAGGIVLAAGTIGIIMAGKTLKVDGFIIEADYRHALNQESSQTLRFRGGAGLWQ